MCLCECVCACVREGGGWCGKGVLGMCMFEKGDVMGVCYAGIFCCF